MGGLSNFDSVCEFFPKNGYRVIIPELPLYSLSLIKTNVKTYANYVADFIKQMGFDEKEVISLGNSLGGHIGLLCTRFQERKSTRLNSSHVASSYGVFCLKKKIRGHTLSVRTAHLTGATDRYPAYSHRHSISCRRYAISRTYPAPYRYLCGWINDTIKSSH